MCRRPVHLISYLSVTDTRIFSPNVWLVSVCGIRVNDGEIETYEIPLESAVGRQGLLLRLSHTNRFQGPPQLYAH